MLSSATNIAILGSTGSIGRNSLEVIKSLPDRFKVTYLTANKNIELLAEQIRTFRPRGVAVLDAARASTLKNQLNGSVEFFTGVQGLKEIVRRDDVDIVISSLVGFAGLEPTIEAIRHRKTIALANKETLVAAGQLITGLLKEYGVQLIPIDSEHSAILQCLQGEDLSRVARLILTASGGPFLLKPVDDFGSITVAEALNHPNWRMGNKITIDSATLMNKGLEVIEAHWLFGLPPEKIDVVIHPQSVIHSMVEFVDGSVKAQLGMPDMKLPIQYALTFPHRFPMNGERMSFPKLRSMTFFEPDRNKFRCLQLAYDALSQGGTLPAVMNAANEIAVEAFLGKRISFKRIPDLIEKTMTSHKTSPSPELPDIIEADRLARQHAVSLI
jgi:1-deoxy-D-xylulose-5-phosphate reductoisomerase